MPVTTAVISGVLESAPLLVYFFEEGGDVEGYGSTAESSGMRRPRAAPASPQSVGRPSEPVS